MAPEAHVIDVLFGGDGTSWRLYVAPFSRLGVLQDRSGPDGVIAPVPQPDFADLDRFMWEADSPYEKQPTHDVRAVQIVARGRSAVTILAWLGAFLADGPQPTA